MSRLRWMEDEMGVEQQEKRGGRQRETNYTQEEKERNDDDIITAASKGKINKKREKWKDIPMRHLPPSLCTRTPAAI